MPAPFNYHQEAYNGSDIIISVERDTGTYDSPAFGPVPLHTVTAFIDGVVVLTEGDPLRSVDSRLGLDTRLPAILQTLKDNIDGADEFSLIMADLSFTGGSEPIENYTVTPGSGSFTHDWTNDPDIDIESLQQANDADFTVSLTTIHSGALTPSITDSSYGSGVTRYFRIRGQRSGEDPGPWSYGSGTTL